MQGRFHLLDTLSLIGPYFTQHCVQLGLHLLVSHLGLGVSFNHLHLHFGELIQFFLFLLSGPVNFVDFPKSFFMNGLGLILVKLDDILA
jgi:hypothetical protein